MHQVSVFESEGEISISVSVPGAPPCMHAWYSHTCMLGTPPAAIRVYADTAHESGEAPSRRAIKAPAKRKEKDGRAWGGERSTWIPTVKLTAAVVEP